jgi:hypothetical protein
MKKPTRFAITGAVAAVAAAIAVASGLAGKAGHADLGAPAVPPPGPANEINVALTPSSAQLATCMPNASLNVKVRLGDDHRGADDLDISGHGLPADSDFTVFLLQQAASPFGAAEYIGDFSTDRAGNTHQHLTLIVGEAFSSTIVGGVRTRVDLNQIGVWFADPAEDDFCFGTGGGSTTPFDGDGNAGVQAFNSANADPLPAP